MSSVPLSAISPDSGKLLDALRRGDEPAADEFVREFSADEIRSLAEGLMRRRRWSEAAWLFARVQPRDAATEMKRCLSGNLAVMQSHRPEIYQQLVQLPATDAFGIAPSPSGRPTVLTRRTDGSITSLAGGPDPLAAAMATLAQVRRAAPNGESIGLCGLGDGYLLQILAQNPPELFMDMRQAVFVLEPEPQIVLHALMIHDLGGDDGPIAAERFRWFVGTSWLTQLNDAVERQPTLGVPGITLQQGPAAADISAGVQTAIQHIVERDNAARREVETCYTTLTPGVLAELLGENPPRAPRILLLTTRFSTVLQHSSRDTADAFRALGWDAQVLIEPSPSHRMYQPVIRRAIADFRPDVFLQIDHLRHEHRDLIPANLPFVCWGQDHLPNLITPDAGRRVGPLDFVLTDNPGGYARNYAYPARQLIATSKLTVTEESIADDASEIDVRDPETLRTSQYRHPERSEGSRGEAAPLNSKVPRCARDDSPLQAITAAPRVDDIVFVSNASRTPQQLLREVGETWDSSDFALNILRDGAQRVLARYDAGESVSTYGEIRAIVRDVQAVHGIALAPDETLAVSKWLTHPFNDALYRQQALRWTASAAKELGLSLGLYGNGWNEHPDFAAYARGPVAYGEALRELTRRAAINLQIVPYLCLHQRLLDGLAAGGFFLVRQNPNDVHPQALLNFLEDHAGPAARTTAAARAAIAPHLLSDFERLLALAAPGIVSTDAEDAVALVRDWADAGNLQIPSGSSLPASDTAPETSSAAYGNRHSNILENIRMAANADLPPEVARGAGPAPSIDHSHVLKNMRITGTEVLPRLGAVSFNGEGRLRELFARFARDPHARREVAALQRAAVVGRMSYLAGMDRVRRRIAELLSETAREAAEGAKRCA
jgi:hypothetical protein